MPADLSPAARAIWRHVIAEMGATGVITHADRDVLRVYCDSVVRYLNAASMLERSGLLIVATGTGARRGELVRNPLHQIVRDSAILVSALARELGLTPAARTGLHAALPEAQRDPFADFLGDVIG